MSKPVDLALYGGRPVRTDPWPTYCKGYVNLNDDDINAVCRAVKSLRLFRYDKRPFEETETGQFEHHLKEHFSVKHALAVSSGTAAITLGLLACGLTPGSYVACPGFTFPATASAIILAGHKPLLIEVDENLHLDVEDLKQKYIPEMEAIVPVHMRGMASDIEAIVEFANEKKMAVVEDAVASCGVTFKGKKLGTFGNVGAFSTQSDKSINTGEGGFLLTNDRQIFEKAVKMSGAYRPGFNHHFPDSHDWIVPEDYPLFNFRMAELLGALAREQLQRLDIHLEKQRAVYDGVVNRLKKQFMIEIRQPVVSDAILGEALILHLKKTTPELTEWFVSALNAEGIDAWTFGATGKKNIRAYWNWGFVFKDEPVWKVKKELPNTTNYLSNAIDIPVSALLTEKDQDDLAEAIHKICDYIKHHPELVE